MSIRALQRISWKTLRIYRTLNRYLVQDEQKFDVSNSMLKKSSKLLAGDKNYEKYIF